MTHKEFVSQYIWKRVNEPWYGYECVALSKLYWEEVYWDRPWAFGWSALAWWKNANGTFDDYERVINDYWDKNNYPSQWDMIFFNNMFGVYGHVAIVDYSDWISVRVLEQNWENWSSSGKNGDEIRLTTYSFKDVLWRYVHPSSKKTFVSKPILVEHTPWSISADNKFLQKLNDIKLLVDKINDIYRSNGLS